MYFNKDIKAEGFLINKKWNNRNQSFKKTPYIDHF